jgi:hypothetical protein
MHREHPSAILLRGAQSRGKRLHFRWCENLHRHVCPLDCPNIVVKLTETIIDKINSTDDYTLGELLALIKEKSASIATAVGNLETLIGEVDE